ncbi:MAG: hypothetical protein HC895_08530 [Leptolyngbyaceae cyanobacterium SM1_3_5]|nr:hypothetical protein [Leptolyngbyaceae cyanobacterium SM1_3_5]
MPTRSRRAAIEQPCCKSGNFAEILADGFWLIVSQTCIRLTAATHDMMTVRKRASRNVARSFHSQATESGD